MTGGRAKRKAEKQQLQESGEWHRCMFFHTHKRRYCNQMRAKGGKYCTHHRPSSDVPSDTPERMPCPLDPGHSIAVRDLEKHLKKCNKHHDILNTTSLPFYSLNINSGNAARRTSIKTPSLMDKIRISYHTYFKNGIIESIKMHPSTMDYYNEKKKISGLKVLRHIRQQSSIVAHALRNKTCDSFIELGAGRAELSHVLSKAIDDPQTSSFVLIDRARVRHKADRYIPNVTRHTIDLRHLDFNKLYECKKKHICAVSKHLCGVATDLSLRGIVNTHVDNMALAMCCHHRCLWEDYVNPDFFLNQGFTSSDFNNIVRMSSWATSCHTEVGRMCKRLIDAGRVEYLKKVGYKAHLVYYCTLEDSLENCLLVATF